MTPVRSELETRIRDWAAQNNVGVSYENAPYTKPKNKTPFVETYIVPADTRDVTVDGTRQRYLGVFYVNVWTADGRGAGESDRLVASLTTAFPVVPKTGNVSIEKTPSARKSIYEDGWRVVPVVIYYRYEA